MNNNNQKSRIDFACGRESIIVKDDRTANKLIKLHNRICDKCRNVYETKGIEVGEEGERRAKKVVKIIVNDKRGWRV